MSKSVFLTLKVPDKYDKAVVTDIIRAICRQVDQLSEGQIVANYQAQTSAPASVAGNVGDIVRDSNATARGSVAPGIAASYVRLGWICTVADNSNATWQEIRTLTGA